MEKTLKINELSWWDYSFIPSLKTTLARVSLLLFIYPTYGKEKQRKGLLEMLALARIERALYQSLLNLYKELDFSFYPSQFLVELEESFREVKALLGSNYYRQKLSSRAFALALINLDKLYREIRAEANNLQKEEMLAHLKRILDEINEEGGILRKANPKRDDEKIKLFKY